MGQSIQENLAKGRGMEKGNLYKAMDPFIMGTLKRDQFVGMEYGSRVMAGNMKGCGWIIRNMVNFDKVLKDLRVWDDVMVRWKEICWEFCLK